MRAGISLLACQAATASHAPAHTLFSEPALLRLRWKGCKKQTRLEQQELLLLLLLLITFFKKSMDAREKQVGWECRELQM